MVGRPNRKPKVIDFDRAKEKAQEPDRRGPTPERVLRAVESFTVGDDKQGSRTWTMQDAPLDRLRKQGKLPSLRYEALNKYRLHWYHGALAGTISTMDLNRVFASDVTKMDGLPKGERQVFHRESYQGARTALRKMKSPNTAMDNETFAHKCLIVVGNVLLSEQTLEIAGYAIGAKSPYRAREAAKMYLEAAADELIDFWGMAGKRR